MDTSPPFPIFYLIGLGQTLGAILGEPLERASASSPDCVVVATKDENGFEVSQLEPKEIKPKASPLKATRQAVATR